MQALSDRTASFTDSVIRRMTRISNQYGAVNLSQGFPDFDPPKPILDRLSQVAYEDYHQYSITWGAQDFREALAKKQSHFMGRDIDPNGEIVVTCGSTEAMMAAMMTVANPGDKVVIFSPFYENYSADTILSGAVPIYVPLTPPSFTFDPEVLEDAFRQHPKALVLCNPSNPCGKVFTREELEIIARLAKKYDVYVITDEVYEHIIYAPHQHTYFATLPDMWERTLSCSSLSKTYSITGWRLGYIIAPPEIIDRAKKVHDFLTVGAAAPLQEAVIPGLRFGQDYYDGLQATYTRKRDLFLRGLDDLKLAHTDPQGAYYVLLDVSEFGYDSDLAFCEDLAREVGYIYVDTGAMYRCVTLCAMRNGLFDSKGNIDVPGLERLMPQISVSFMLNEATGLPEVCLNGENVEHEIRTMEVSSHVSSVAALPFVRAALVAQQQRMGQEKGIVMDGRDIGTTVFPDAELKIFVTADAGVRARRRYDELKAKGMDADLEDILRNVEQRDYIDSHREVSPLTKAADAIVLDNSHMTIAEQKAWLMERFAAAAE